MNAYNELWQSILKELEKLYSEETYQELFFPIETPYKHQNGLITMLVPKEFIKTRINRLYIAKINELATQMSDTPVRFKFITEDDLEPNEANPQKPKITIQYKQGNLNQTYTFDSFVVGKSNTFAFRMAMKVADQPGVVANPFYIFGDVGLGKTHLMQAIGNYILDNNITQKVLYVKADSFIEDFTNQLKNQKMEDFNSKYRDLDVLLIDDIQIMANATKTQMEFFKLFDYLYLNNKQIVITSDKPANELKNIMSRLTTRFEQGLSVDVGIPDLDHRINILKRKLISFDFSGEIADEVLEFVATSFVTNIREMEGALIRLINYAQSFNSDYVDLEFAYEALEPLLKTKRVTNSLSENNYDKIMSIVADYYNISIQDLISKKRSNKFTLPRHLSMYLIKFKYNVPYKTIGSLFGDRSHSTILSAYERVQDDLKHDHNLRLALEAIIKKIDHDNVK